MFSTSFFNPQLISPQSPNEASTLRFHRSLLPAFILSQIILTACVHPTPLPEFLLGSRHIMTLHTAPTWYSLTQLPAAQYQSILCAKSIWKNNLISSKNASSTQKTAVPFGCAAPAQAGTFSAIKLKFFQSFSGNCLLVSLCKQTALLLPGTERSQREQCSSNSFNRSVCAHPTETTAALGVCTVFL